MWPGFDSCTRRHMWVKFVVGSRPCSEKFFSGYSGFPLSSKTNNSDVKLEHCFLADKRDFRLCKRFIIFTYTVNITRLTFLGDGRTLSRLGKKS